MQKTLFYQHQLLNQFITFHVKTFSDEHNFKCNFRKSEAILFGQFSNVTTLKLNNQGIEIQNKVKCLKIGIFFGPYWAKKP